MNDSTIRINTLLADVSVYLVTKYNISPRDAAGLVMQSPVAECLREENSPLLDLSVEQLAARMF